MQTMKARSRNTLMLLDIVGFLFSQDDRGARKKISVFDEDEDDKCS